MLTVPRSTVVHWKRGGRCLRAHRIPVLDPDSGVVTSVALDADWLVAGLANHRIHIFSTHTGSLVRTLVGHELGVWAVDLVSRGGALDPAHPRPPPHNPGTSTTNGGSFPDVADGPALLLHNRAPAGAQALDPQGLDHLLPPSMRAALALDVQYPSVPPTCAEKNDSGRAESARSDVAGATRGWGQPGALVVSGGCDKDVRVWDVQTGSVSPLPVLVVDPDSRGWGTGIGGQSYAVRPSRAYLDCALSQSDTQPAHCGEWVARWHAARVGCAARADVARPCGSRWKCTLARCMREPSC
jgi:hypothetical protein